MHSHAHSFQNVLIMVRVGIDKCSSDYDHYVILSHASVSLQLGGRGGGYKELDEEEIEETRRRRREAEEDDGEMYDEFGNLKKKFRAKMQQIDNGSTLPGSGRAGWEVELGRDSKERGKERVRDHSSRESSKSRDRDGHLHERERRRSQSRERDRDYYEKERSRDKDRDKDRERVQDYERGREYRRDRDRHRDW
ncbi:hypothetical protein Taro_050002 [Colocasia esculenta]|uniref:Uncharacterized protein n=1 Tax=Colocasia esculenta TaxID=4460 RepID=A0A843XCJ3_COLES|nr:hypothetical protein [Colocasia esculenta]